MDYPEISETAVHFSSLHHPLSNLQGAMSIFKKQNPAFHFFFSPFFNYLRFFPLPHHLRQSKLWLTNSINILTVILLGKEAPVAFPSLQALAVPEGLRVISR